MAEPERDPQHVDVINLGHTCLPRGDRVVRACAISINDQAPINIVRSEGGGIAYSHGNTVGGKIVTQSGAAYSIGNKTGVNSVTMVGSSEALLQALKDL